MGRSELFPRDWGLTAQMVLIALITPVVVIAVLVWVLLIGSDFWRIVIGLGLVGGAGAVLRDWRSRPSAEVAGAPAPPELAAIVQRLCVLADVTAPRIVIEPFRQPNSWLVHVPRRPAELHVTLGLLALLDGDELAAVIAHELSHLANGDATLMTVVGMPGMITASGATRGPGALFLKLVSGVSATGTNALSRRRELAADRGASALTGHPSALASALIKVSEGVARTPLADLREVALADSFRLVPSAQGGRRGLVDGLGETHPPLQRRLEALEQLEHHLQHARAAL